MRKTNITSCDHTQNFWVRCNRVSDGCKHCYMEPGMKRTGEKRPFRGPRRTTSTWSDPFKFNRMAAKDKRRHRVFTCSWSDFFHPGADKWRDEAWEVIRQTQNLDWLILTKRPELMSSRMPDDWGDGWPHVWLGATVEAQQYLKDRVTALLAIPARIHYISAEPLLEAIDFRPYLDEIDWVIVGCENAAKEKRRPMDLDWARDIRDRCRATDTAFFFKQRYVGTTLTRDGMLDGKCCQEWPLPCRSLRRRPAAATAV